MYSSNFQDLLGQTAGMQSYRFLELLKKSETIQKDLGIEEMQELFCVSGTLNGVFGTPDLDVLSFYTQALIQKAKDNDNFLVIGDKKLQRDFLLGAAAQAAEVSKNDVLDWENLSDSTKAIIENKVSRRTTLQEISNFPVNVDFLTKCIAKHLKQKESSKNCTHIVIGAQMAQTPKSNLASEIKEKMSTFKKHISITFVENFKWRAYIPGGDAQKSSSNFIFEECELTPKISEILDFCALLRFGPVGRAKGFRKEDIQHNVNEAKKKKEATVVNCFYKKSSEKIEINESNFWFSPTRCTFYAKKPDFQTYVPEAWKGIP